MAINYPLTLPTATGIKRVTIRMRSVVAVTESAFTLQRQVQAHQGQRFEATVELPPMVRADADEWIAWLAKLNGQEGTFTMGDPAAASPRGTGGGAPLVNGASQTGNSLVTDGWNAGEGVLKAGDYIQLGSGSTARLYKILNDVTSDGSGNATLDIWPSLRSSPANNDPITVTSTVGLWRLAGNVSSWDADEATLYGITFDAVEAL